MTGRMPPRMKWPREVERSSWGWSTKLPLVRPVPNDELISIDEVTIFRCLCLVSFAPATPVAVVRATICVRGTLLAVATARGRRRHRQRSWCRSRRCWGCGEGVNLLGAEIARRSENGLTIKVKAISARAKATAYAVTIGIEKHPIVVHSVAKLVGNNNRVVGVRAQGAAWSIDSTKAGVAILEIQ